MPDSIFELQAELCQKMGNASRLRIVHSLRAGPKRVSDIVQATGLTQAKVSQHLALLRASGIVVAQRHGRDMIYRIVDPKIGRVCDLMREVLLQQSVERSKLFRALQEKT
jgi:DNA-binding transcriptional ArsR family regulator